MDTTATLRAMRLVGRELVHQYTSALDSVVGIASRSLRTALSRAIVQDVVLSAHIARRSDDPADERDVPHSVSACFATGEARVCMRCLLDRAGRNSVLQRDESFEPHPHKVVSLKVTSKGIRAPSAQDRAVVTPQPRQLRAARVDEVQLPGNTRTDALSKTIVALDEASAVEWEEKRRTRHESADVRGTARSRRPWEGWRVSHFGGAGRSNKNVPALTATDMAKIARHDAMSEAAAPTKGPTTPAAPVQAAHTPNRRARSMESFAETLIIATTQGSTSAAAPPCSARAAISTAPEVDVAASAADAA
ncbi:MAG TPA: hypothetical protein VIF32_10280 [Gemmatimonadaceae bacterium]